ncbi:hypothetical protein Slin14017_G060960 [Septoria linicola]|nr:hypothetical protein Slin14017_G060960 [Septoria linicola]
MFMNSMFAGFNTTDPEQERDPPPAATPVTFPYLPTVDDNAWRDPSLPPKLQRSFSQISKPSDVSDDHLGILNVSFAPECEPDDLVPETPDGKSYFPPLAPGQAINPASYAAATKVDSAAVAKRKAFDERLGELRVDNDTGIRVITRTLKPGPKPRLAYMRKFWEGLESVAQYWDTSLDHYYRGTPARTDEAGEKGAKRQRLDSVPSIMNLQTGPREHSGNSSAITKGSGTGAHDDTTAIAASIPLPTEANEGQLEDRLRYKGRRTSTGCEMPDQFRSDMVKAFVDGTTYPFGSQVAPPRHMPLVQIHKLNVPVRQTAAVYRRPRDRLKARNGFLEGPVMTVQCRPEIDFHATHLSEKEKHAKARLDAMRELGGLLQLAQERQRQGRTEQIPGEGKWWTTKPRWGGGPGDEVAKQEDPESANLVKDVLQMAEEMVANASVHRNTARRPKRKTPAMLWKELKPGSKMWDAKMDYEAIGKDPNSHYDEVFMVSSLNHHISILKLRVHVAYLEYLRTETMPNPLPEDTKWSRPELQRTKWYDLLDVDERVQAFRALWGVSAYLFREMKSPEDDSSMHNS